MSDKLVEITSTLEDLYQNYFNLKDLINLQIDDNWDCLDKEPMTLLDVKFFDLYHTFEKLIDSCEKNE